MRGELSGAACAELPPQVVDHLFGANVNIPTGRVLARAAMNICNRHCPVRAECLDSAMHGERVVGGVIAGVSANLVIVARLWLDYENGILEHPPTKGLRPEWPPFIDAFHATEDARMLEDQDEQESELPGGSGREKSRDGTERGRSRRE